jgi:hypothetical protein
MINPGSPELSIDEERDLFYHDKLNDHYKEALNQVVRFFGTFQSDRLLRSLARSVRDEDQDATEVWESLSLGELECLAACGDFEGYKASYDEFYSNDGD